MKQKKFESLCVRFLSGNLNDEEKQSFDQMISHSPEKRRIYEQMNTVWETSRPPAFKKRISADNVWHELQGKLSAYHNISVAAKKKKLGNTILRPSIIFASAVALTLLALRVGLWVDNNPALIEISTNRGERKTFELPDGSEVTLNCDSRIAFIKPMKDGREIRLGGEAFFKVRNNKNPFVVITDNARTTVLGTAFNVRARNSNTEVVVRSGSVKLAPEEDLNSEILLYANQKSAVKGESMPEPPQSVDIDQALGWLNGQLIFIKRPLPDVLEELKIYYNVDIQIADLQLRTRTLTATFEDYSVETVLSAISAAMKVRIEKEEGVYYIFN